MYTFSFTVGNVIPKSVKCIHSATKTICGPGWHVSPPFGPCQVEPHPRPGSLQDIALSLSKVPECSSEFVELSFVLREFLLCRRHFLSHLFSVSLRSSRTSWLSLLSIKPRAIFARSSARAGDSTATVVCAPRITSISVKVLLLSPLIMPNLITTAQ